MCRRNRGSCGAASAGRLRLSGAKAAGRGAALRGADESPRRAAGVVWGGGWGGSAGSGPGIKPCLLWRG